MVLQSSVISPCFESPESRPRAPMIDLWEFPYTPQLSLQILGCTFALATTRSLQLQAAWKDDGGPIRSEAEWPLADRVVMTIRG